jgi:hypothetical protein
MIIERTQEEFSNMMRKELSETLADISGRAMTTIEIGLIPKLQAARLVPARNRWDAGVDASYRVTVLLATILDQKHGVSPAEAVRHWRALPFTGGSDELARNLGIETSNAGAALDSILETLRTWPGRSPILDAAAGGNINVAAEFHGEDSMVLVFHGPTRSMGTLNFGSSKPNDAGRVERILRLSHRAFERLAV